MPEIKYRPIVAISGTVESHVHHSDVHGLFHRLVDGLLQVGVLVEEDAILELERIKHRLLGKSITDN